MLNWDSEIIICSRFVNCELVSFDTNSTLGSVVPLAMFHDEIVQSTQDLTLPWMKCPTTELSLLSPVQGHITLSWRNLSKKKVQKRMWRSILLSRPFAVKPVKTLFQSTNVCPTIECSTSRTLAARASFKLLSTRFENFHSESFFCMSVIRKESYAMSVALPMVKDMISDLVKNAPKIPTWVLISFNDPDANWWKKQATSRTWKRILTLWTIMVVEIYQKLL